VFLLREVFSYDYKEIATIVERTEASCRQLVKRARDRITDDRPARFEAAERTHRQLTESFLSATTDGNIDGLLSVLSTDVELHSAHGGKAQAARNTLRGAEVVSKFMLGLREKSCDWDVVPKVIPMNGRTGIAFILNGQLQSVFRFEVEDGRIARVYATVNPDKLAHVAEALEE